MWPSGTSVPSRADTFFNLMREPVRSSIWLNDTVFFETALVSFTGMLTSPKLMEPLQRGRAIPPLSASEHRASNEIGPKGRQDGQIEESGRGHHGRVRPLFEGGSGDDNQPERGDRA